MTIPSVDADMKKVSASLAMAKFCDGGGNPTPAFRFLTHPQAETNKKVNAILRGLRNGWWPEIENKQRLELPKLFGTLLPKPMLPNLVSEPLQKCLKPVAMTGPKT